MTTVPTPAEATAAERLTYAFGHLVSSHRTDAHAGDSGELALDALEAMGLAAETVEALEVLAEYVAGNYRYTGEATDTLRKIQAGLL